MALQGHLVGQLQHRPFKHAHALEVVWQEEWLRESLPQDNKGACAGVSSAGVSTVVSCGLGEQQVPILHWKGRLGP